MDRLRRNRGVVRAAATRIITSATEALQLENTAPADLQVILDDLQDKDTTLADLNKKIADLMTDGAEYEEELTAALEYHDKIRNTMSRIRYLLNSATRPADSAAPVVATEAGPQGVSAQGAVLMQTATVWASGRHDSVLVRILLDTGSQRTFVRRDLSTSLDLPCVGTEDRSLLTFGSSKRTRTHQYRTVQLKLQSRFDAQEITMDALEVPEVCTVKTPAIGQGLLMQLHERKMLIADEQRIGHRPTQTISVIIGSDNCWRIVTGKIERLSNDLCAVETIFGWMVQGIYQEDSANDLHQGNYSTSALFLSCERHSQAASCMADPTEMWRLDAIGITDPPEATGTWDQEPLSLFRQYVHKDAGRYVVPLMIKYQGRLACTSRSVAENQLQRLKGQRKLLDEYDRAI
ncbi:hypothetical protein MTO96_044006, partial [Rhipicephalus appendiculatus]